MNEKERLLAALAGENVDRSPFIGPGGMMTVAILEVMDTINCHWPKAHSDPVAMAKLGKGMHDLAFFENFGVPFCLTVEAEAMGAPVEMGSRETEPMVTSYVLKDIDDFESLNGIEEKNGSRAEVVLEAIRILAEDAKEIPITGNLTGPISLATSLIDPQLFFRAMRTDPVAIHKMLSFIADNLIDFGKAQIRAGVDVLVIADPSATGEILGPKAFGEFALPYINRIIEGLGDDCSSRTVTHICGRIQSIVGELNKLRSAGLSIDSLVNLSDLKKNTTGKFLVGNVSTQLLDQGPTDRIIKAGLQCLKRNVDILAPACGISPRTKLEHIRALASVVKRVNSGTVNSGDTIPI